ncbi:MAG: MBOAT family protein [Mogibacterium sp.]|nr:MBOAT family protein [Mogibacterium sp.]
MVFSSLIFIFGFLPPCILLVWASRKNNILQNIILTCASLFFYSWGEPKHVWLFVITVSLNWIMTLVAKRAKKDTLQRIIGSITILIDLAILFWFKYAGWIGNGLGCSIGSLVLPIGISFYTFQAISYVADVTLLNKYPAEKNPINVSLYIAFFPQLIAGPIVRYEEMRDQINRRTLSIDLFEEGAFRFAYGFCKKVLLADTMGIIANKAFNAGDNLTCTFAWLGAIAYSFQIFMDFSGYSDMAIGLGAIFGFRIPENFKCPYMARSIRDFWRRWHITLSIWFRDYVYIPLGGNRNGKLRMVINIAVVWLLTGLWHGANITFVIWGGAYGTFVLMEKLLGIEKQLEKATTKGRLAYRFFTLLTILILWVFFRADNIGVAMNYLRQMFSFGLEQFDETLLYITELKWAFLGSFVLSVIPFERINSKRTIAWPVIFLLFLVSVSYLVKGTFSPFLYFNF